MGFNRREKPGLASRVPRLTTTAVGSGGPSQFVRVPRAKTNAMDIADYLAIGFLTACMLCAGAMALHKAR
jgi:hypothetical protein